jgi:outer membrane protein OmpA-like peptidoglycan-associated protein
MWRNLLICFALLVPLPALAHTYEARLDQSVWHLDPSPLKCRLWQAVPNYGDAVFETNAGESLKFYLDLYRPVKRAGKAEMAIVAPNWRDGISPRKLGKTTFNIGRRPIELADEVASELLAELQVGMMPSFTHPGWAGKHDVSVGVSAVNFQSAFTGYVSCVAGLYPANFGDLRKSYLHFETNKYGIKGDLKERLDLIAGYIAIDTSVQKIYIDGHTDSDGRRGHNWELSRLRAKAVQDYLQEKGVFADMIVMKYHGEGRPARKNSSKGNKAFNRRVMVSLLR